MTRNEMRNAAQDLFRTTPNHALRPVAHRLIWPPNATSTKGMLTAARQILEYINS